MMNNENRYFSGKIQNESRVVYIVKFFMILYNNKLITSDRHILHTNIAVYEYERRYAFFPYSIYKQELVNFLNKWKNKDRNYFIKHHNINFLSFLKNKIKNIIHQIDEFIHLGDFVFNVSDYKIQKLKELEIKSCIDEIFDIFEKNNITKQIIIWNHCESILYKKSLNSFYLDYFDEISYYKQDKTKQIIYTHYPVWFVPYKNETVPDFFQQQNARLLKDLQGFSLNIHWHTHDRDYKCENTGLNYISAWWWKCL